jgi:hypothetical protein
VILWTAERLDPVPHRASPSRSNTERGRSVFSGGEGGI